MAEFINPIGALFAINIDAPLWVRHRLKGRGTLTTKRAWKCVDCFTRDGELFFTLKNVWDENESLPSKYFHLFNYN